MLDISKGMEILTALIKGNTTHQDYNRTVELAKKYTALITGEGVGDMLQQFAKREDKDLFEQRKALTQAITPAVAEAIMMPFQKVPRSSRIKAVIRSKDAEAIASIQKAVKGFYGDDAEASGLDQYLATRFIELTFTDPNAFLAVEFDPFDPIKEKAQPKPVEISSEAAVDFQYKNGVLQYLIARWSRMYQDSKGKATQGSRFVMYLVDEAITLDEVDPRDMSAQDAQLAQEPGAVLVEIGENDAKRRFIQRTYQPKSGTVPAFRVGYKRDMHTKGRSYVSPLHPAMPYFMKSLKTVSELDLTMSLHTFPQKLQYVTPCPGDAGKGCIQGKTRGGQNCALCGGSGSSQVHKSAHDVVLLPMPKDGSMAMDLEKILVYKQPPIDLVKFQKEYVDYLKEQAVRAVYNSSQFMAPTIQKTATEVDDQADAINDTLAPFASQLSSIWMAMVRLISVYVEASKAEDLLILHKCPKDFKLRSQASLLRDLTAANNSGAPAYVLDSINTDLLEIMYADEPDQVAKLKVKQKYLPFKGKSPDAITAILMSPLTTQYHKVLYANFEEIWSSLEEEHGDKLYLLEDSKQRAIVRQAVDKLSDEISKAQAKALSTMLPPAKQEKDPDNE